MSFTNWGRRPNYKPVGLMPGHSGLAAQYVADRLNAGFELEPPQRRQHESPIREKPRGKGGR